MSINRVDFIYWLIFLPLCWKVTDEKTSSNSPDKIRKFKNYSQIIENPSNHHQSS